MAGSQKTASSTADSKKKTPSPDDPIEEDFLSSWKSKKSGKDTLDFGTETVPQDRKKAFDFDKLDDFELGGDFGKISSFKVDMSDLDFSSPHRKTEKPKERPGKEPVMGKKDEKMDTFSFTFDFNVLDGFDLDSNLLKGGKNTSKCPDNEVPKSSVKIHKNPISRSNSLTSSDILEKNDMKLLDDIACSQHLTDIQGKLDVTSGVSCIPLPNREQHNNVSLKELSSPMKQINSTERSQNGCVGHTEQLEMIESEKALARQLVHDAEIQYGDDSAQDTHSQFSANPTVEQENSVKAMSTSHSRSSSPVTSCNLKRSLSVSMTESPSTDNGIQKHLGNTTESARESLTVNDAAMVNVGVEDASMTDDSHKMLPKMGGNEDKQISSPRYPQAVLGRDSGYEMYMPLKEKGAGALQLKPLNRSEATESQLHLSTSKQLYAINNKKKETMRLSPVIEKRESRNAEQPENHKGSILKSLSRSLTKSGSVILGNDRSEKDSYAFCTPNSISPKLLSSTASIKTFKAVPTEKHGTSMDVKTSSDISSMKISRVISSNSNASNPTVQQEMKSVECSKGNVEIHLNTRPMMAHSLITEKRTLLSPPLKRKSLEGPNTDPRYLSVLKRVSDSESPIDSRKSLKASPKVYGQLAPRIENADDGCYDFCLDHQNSSVDVPVESKETELRIPVLIEDDGNAEKAESCTKALEDICNMLKKKHEEAKELLVRAIVNNNTLLILNHPMHEEKIRAIQKFASSLLSKGNGI